MGFSVGLDLAAPGRRLVARLLVVAGEKDHTFVGDKVGTLPHPDKATNLGNKAVQ